MWQFMSDSAKKKAKKNGLSRNRSSTMPDNWEENSLLNHTMKNSSSQWKPLGESWKFRCQQQCLAKYRQRAVVKPTATLGNARQNTLVLLMPTKARDQGWKELDTNLVKITSLQKGWILWFTTVLFTSSFRCLKHQENSRRKGTSGERVWNIGENPSTAADESQKQEKKWSREQGIRAEKCTLRHWWISVILRIRSWNLSIKSTQAGSYSEVTLQKMTLVRMQYSLNKDHQHLKWRPQKSWTFYEGFQDVQDRQLMQYPLIQNQVKMEDASTLFKIPKSEWPEIWIRLPKHKWPKSWSSMEDSVVLLDSNLYGHPLAGLMGKAIWKSSIGTRLEKSLKQWMLICQPRKRTIPISVCGRYPNWQAKQKTQNRLGKFSWKTLIWENQHHFLIMYIWDALKEKCKISNESVANYRDMFESRISAGAKEKLSTRVSGKPDAETISSWSYDMEGHEKK